MIQHSSCARRFRGLLGGVDGAGMPGCLGHQYVARVVPSAEHAAAPGATMAADGG